MQMGDFRFPPPLSNGQLVCADSNKALRSDTSNAIINNDTWEEEEPRASLEDEEVAAVQEPVRQIKIQFKKRILRPSISR